MLQVFKVFLLEDVNAMSFLSSYCVLY